MVRYPYFGPKTKKKKCGNFPGIPAFYERFPGFPVTLTSTYVRKVFFFQIDVMMAEFRKNVRTLLTTFLALTCLVAAIGLLGNIALIKSFWKQRNQHRFNKLMITLATFDGLFLVSQVSLEAYKFKHEIISFGTLYSLKLGNLILVTALVYITGFLFACSVITALLILIERYLALANNKYGYC